MNDPKKMLDSGTLSKLMSLGIFKEEDFSTLTVDRLVMTHGIGGISMEKILRYMESIGVSCAEDLIIGEITPFGDIFLREGRYYASFRNGIEMPFENVAEYLRKRKMYQRILEEIQAKGEKINDSSDY